MVVSIDMSSREEAQLIAASLPTLTEVLSARGYTIVRLKRWQEREIPKLLSLVAECVDRHRIRWARVRFGDEERTFRSQLRA